MQNELKIGDAIAIDERMGDGVILAKIKRLTDTMYVCDSHMRFRKKDLRLIGSSSDMWSPSHGRIPTDSDLLRRRLHKARVLMRRFSVDEDSLEDVEKLLRAYPENWKKNLQ